MTGGNNCTSAARKQAKECPWTSSHVARRSLLSSLRRIPPPKKSRGAQHVTVSVRKKVVILTFETMWPHVTKRKFKQSKLMGGSEPEKIWDNVIHEKSDGLVSVTLIRTWRMWDPTWAEVFETFPSQASQGLFESSFPLHLYEKREKSGRWLAFELSWALFSRLNSNDPTSYLTDGQD